MRAKRFLGQGISVEQRDKPPGVVGIVRKLLGESVSEHGLFDLHTIPIRTHHRNGERHRHDPVGCGKTRAKSHKEIRKVTRMPHQSVRSPGNKVLLCTGSQYAGVKSSQHPARPDP